MNDYSRGYAAGQEEMRRRAAETCKTMAKVFATTDRYAVLSGAADACGSAILSLPIQGEAEGSDLDALEALAKNSMTVAEWLDYDDALHKNSEELLRLARIGQRVERDAKLDDFLSQALNEGDGVYRP